MCPALDSAMLLLLPGTLLMWPKSLPRLFDDEMGEPDKAFNEGLLLLRTLLCTNSSLVAELCILIGRSSVNTNKFEDYLKLFSQYNQENRQIVSQSFGNIFEIRPVSVVQWDNLVLQYQHCRTCRKILVRGRYHGRTNQKWSHYCGMIN